MKFCRFFKDVFENFCRPINPLWNIAGYSLEDRVRIIDRYNCYGIDSVLKYLR